MNRRKANCYTWSAPFEDEDQMQLEEGIKRASLGRSGGYMLWGDIVIEGKRAKVHDDPQDDVTLVFVQTRAGVESHDLDPQPHFWESHTWIGADGESMIHHEGRWNKPDKKQLFRLSPGGSILFFDARCEVTKLTAKSCGEKPERVRATDDEVATYIVTEAKKRGHIINTRVWCYHALKELGCPQQLAEFRALFPQQGFRA
jgi:hypothetical protein